MFTAEQARYEVLRYNDERLSIYNRIKKAAMKGRNEIWINANTSQDIIDELKNEAGFIIEDVVTVGPNEIRVSW